MIGAMRLLILGGTVFLGRALARQALAAGLDVTTAARGVTGQAIDGVRFVRVDRDDPAGLSVFDGETFDAVIDVTRRPSHARYAVAALGDRIRHWSFVSTGSVYADGVTPGQQAATAPLLDPAPTDVDDPTGDNAQWYGPCKVTCESVVRDGVGADRAFICRAGLIVGPEDISDRFPYWVRRLAAGGEVLAPGEPDELVQFIDVPDLAGWLLHAAQTGLAGTYDGTGPAMPRARCLAEVAAGVGRPDPQLTWVGQDFLEEHDVRPWSGERALPLWLPLPAYGGFMSRDVSTSLAAGLAPRPLAETARTTLQWITEQPDAVRPGGLSPEAEVDVLREWHGRTA